jgi:hypothetical protein
MSEIGIEPVVAAQGSFAASVAGMIECLRQPVGRRRSGGGH